MYGKKTCFYQGWDKYCPAGKFQWKMPENAGTANTPKITEVANTGIKIELKIHPKRFAFSLC